MFKYNNPHSNQTLFSFEDQLNERMQKKVDFDLRTKKALGLSDMCERPFCYATIFNFQSRLTQYYVNTGENLLESVFDKLTEDQLKTLKINTDIQRTDSFFVASNIRNYSRIQLLVEVLIRLYRVLTEEDKKKYEKTFETYVKTTSGQYIYRLKKDDIGNKLDEIGKVYYCLYNELKENYKDKKIFDILARVYYEHFAVVEDKVEVKPPEKLASGTSGSLQSEE